MIDFTKPLIAIIPNGPNKPIERNCKFIGGPVELRGGLRNVIYFEKLEWDDAYIGNCDDEGKICNPFGNHLSSDFGYITNASPKL